MKKKYNKLELTWVDKDKPYKLEPRLLLEDTQYSFGDANTSNMLIHGDNLLALKALEQDFSGKIKCIYIDPPYNTGSRIDADGKEVGYDDGLEHSEWLCMMKPRLELLYNLLHKEGTLAIQIDDNEFARLYLLLLEVFKSESNLKVICVKMSEATGVKMAHVINNGRIPKLKEYILIARKNGIRNLFVEKIPKEKWDNEYKTFLDGITKQEINFIKEVRENEERKESDIKEVDEILKKIVTKSVSECYREAGITDPQAKNSFNFENAWRISQFVSMTGGAKLIADEKKNKLGDAYNFFSIVTPQGKMYFIRNDYDPSVGIPRIKLLFAEDYLTIHPGDFWQDIKTTGLDNEGGVAFKKGKKPEALVKRVIGMASDENDLVLDSFGGSGTTAAVAHKMKRKWITIEMANHCFSHIVPRLKNVITGKDTQGITQNVNWKGGGGFKFYTLAPSLIQKDKYGNDIINTAYNANMLAAAMAKQEGFRYSPHESTYWKQGNSTEKDYIFTTTQFITVEMLDRLAEEMQPNESLLVCCKGFSAACKSRHSNITIKKIPQMLFGRCEFGKDDYSFNIVNLPHDENDNTGMDEDEINSEETTGKKSKAKSKKKTDDETQSSLF